MACNHQFVRHVLAAGEIAFVCIRCALLTWKHTICSACEGGRPTHTFEIGYMQPDTTMRLRKIKAEDSKI